MAEAEYYVVDRVTGDVIARFPCGDLTDEQRLELGRRLKAQLRPDDWERGIELKDNFTVARPPWQ